MRSAFAKATADNLRMDHERRLVRPARLERATSWFVARRSIQLSYGRVSFFDPGAPAPRRRLRFVGPHSLRRTLESNIRRHEPPRSQGHVACVGALFRPDDQ